MTTLELLLRYAPPPRTIDPAAGTMEIVFATENPVQRRDAEGPFDEVLGLAAGEADFSRLISGPVLDSHRRHSLADMLGTVTAARIENGEAIATIQLSERARPLITDIERGIKPRVSVGYTVDRWAETRAAGRRQKRATHWGAIEVSLVAIAADPAARIRSEDDMTETTTTETRPEADPAGREIAIRGIARLAGLDDAFITAQIGSTNTPEQARTAAFLELARRAPAIRGEASNRVIFGTSHDSPQARAEAMGEALFARMHPAHQLSERGRPFAYQSFAELAAECLHFRGVPITGHGPDLLIRTAMHSTSDFPLLLENAMGKTLRTSYQAAPAALKRLGRETSAPDFRTRKRLMLGEFPTLLKVNEAGEIKSGTMVEGRESYGLATYATKLSLSRELMINDDLGAFAQLGRAAGQAVVQFEAGVLVDLLTQASGDGPTLSDTLTLFHATHANKAASGGAISDTTLSTARTAMRTQKGLGGTAISVPPKFLLVPAAKETEAQKTLSAIYAAQASNVNAFAGVLEPVVEARLDAKSATRWYLTADPAVIDGLEYCYLAGQAGPQIETKAEFDSFAVSMRVWEDFGAGFVDYRSWYANAGA